jgi:hypothetical protein
MLKFFLLACLLFSLLDSPEGKGDQGGDQGGGQDDEGVTPGDVYDFTVESQQ